MYILTTYHLSISIGIRTFPPSPPRHCHWKSHILATYSLTVFIGIHTFPLPALVFFIGIRTFSLPIPSTFSLEFARSPDLLPKHFHRNWHTLSTYSLELFILQVVHSRYLPFAFSLKFLFRYLNTLRFIELRTCPLPTPEAFSMKTVHSPHRPVSIFIETRTHARTHTRTHTHAHTHTRTHTHARIPHAHNTHITHTHTHRVS